jgi:hypothetical protein
VLALGLVLFLGLGLWALADRFSPGCGVEEAVRLALLAATPLWPAGLLFAIPVTGVHLVQPLVALCYVGWLLFTGAHHLLGARPDRAAVVVGVAAARVSRTLPGSCAPSRRLVASTECLSGISVAITRRPWAAAV